MQDSDLMRTLLAGFLCVFSVLGAPTRAQAADSLVFEDIFRGVYAARGIDALRSTADGQHYTLLERPGSRTQIVLYNYRDGQSVDTLFSDRGYPELEGKSIFTYILSPDERKILLGTDRRDVFRRSYTALYFLYDTASGTLEPVSDQRIQQPTFSPDGSKIAYAKDNDLYYKDLSDGSTRRVTYDGHPGRIINGTADWVYEEEFSFNRALEFSPDSKMLAFIRFDEREVPSYTFPVFAGEAPHITPYEKYPGEYTYKYPKTGEKNSKVSVHTFDIKSKVTRKINLPLEEGGYIPRIRFTQDPGKLAIMTLNRHQNRFDLYFADPRSTVCKLAVRDESDTYIRENVFDNIIFYPENFSFVSEKSGYNHLYWYSIGGNLIKQVTSGPYEVQDFLGYDPEDDCFYFSSNEESPLRSAIYKIDRKGKKIKLSSQAGTNSAQFSTNMKYFMNRYSSSNTPTVITLNDNTGKALTTLVDNSALKQKLKGYAIPKKEFFSFQTSDGITLNGWMMKPADFSAGKKYPVLMYQYSGPGSQQVLDKFGVSWETYMASQGYIVACVDGRGTGGRGAEFAKSTYLNLGIKEAKDQVETALYLGRQPYVDKDRIGIWGWSYGGYMTIMSMSEGTPVFKAGVAVAPVTDWNYYDTVYGERFMRTPKENAEGYKASSAFTRANNLHGNLLLVHGMADDNVHFQNCVEYAEHLVQLGKQFDMQVYTNRNHSIFGGNTRLHLYTKLTNFFNRELKK